MGFIPDVLIHSRHVDPLTSLYPASMDGERRGWTAWECHDCKEYCDSCKVLTCTVFFWQRAKNYSRRLWLSHVYILSRLWLWSHSHLSQTTCENTAWTEYACECAKRASDRSLAANTFLGALPTYNSEGWNNIESINLAVRTLQHPSHVKFVRNKQIPEEIMH